MFAKEIKKEQVNQFPLKKYDGEITLVRETAQVKQAFADISRYKVVGFDTETKPTFKKGQGPNPVSLIQIATPGKVYLIRLNYTGTHHTIRNFLSNKKIKKIGISVKNDIKAIQKLDFFQPAAFVDLNDLVKTFDVKNQGIRKLSAIFLGYRISKRMQTSNWERVRLTESQIRYAATDAWVCLKIYEQLVKWQKYVYEESLTAVSNN